MIVAVAGPPGPARGFRTDGNESTVSTVGGGRKVRESGKTTLAKLDTIAPWPGRRILKFCSFSQTFLSACLESI